MSKYDRVIEQVFLNNYSEGDVRVSFNRSEFSDACRDLELGVIKNLGDIIYSYRFRKELPKKIREKCPANCEWIITGAGSACYEFRLASPGKIEPTSNRQKIKILDSTPEIVKLYAPGTDEQALLTKVRYNRLIDTFLGLTCYSIQNHLRTSISSIGQIEIDEVYLGINKKGTHFIIPCQAKSIGDKFGIVQTMQDIEFCKVRYPNAICRPIALQFLSENDVAILELIVEEINNVPNFSIVDEKHYQLSSRNDISDTEIILMSQY